MNSASQLWHRWQQVHSSGLATSGLGERIWNYLQLVWLAVTFLLFLILGPFAAIAVIPAVFSLAGNLQDTPEPEPRQR